MSDDELIRFLDIGDLSPDLRRRVLARITPERRALYDRMRRICERDGLRPRPSAARGCLDD